jgi:hypothetical protein
MDKDKEYEGFLHRTHLRTLRTRVRSGCTPHIYYENCGLEPGLTRGLGVLRFKPPFFILNEGNGTRLTQSLFVLRCGLDTGVLLRQV